MSDADTSIGRHVPKVSEHNEDVLSGLLGLSANDIDALRGAGEKDERRP